MKTPAGKECKYYYEDFHRGRSAQECRLLKHQSDSKRWHPDDCRKCPVPDILHANASEYLRFDAQIQSGLLGFGRHIEVNSVCSKHDSVVEDPYIGCKKCAAELPGLSDWVEGSRA